MVSEFIYINFNNVKIIFISTKSEKDSWYVYYKQMSESYLLQNSKDCLILRFPTIVGSKGTILLLKQTSITVTTFLSFIEDSFLSYKMS